MSCNYSETIFETNNPFEKITNSCKYVSSKAKHVKINYKILDKFIMTINPSEIKYWLANNSFNILDFDTQTIINFLLIYHTIGDYCFWGEPKWSINTENGLLDGSYAIMYLLINRLKSQKDFDLSYKEFKELLSGNNEIPLLKDRYDNLKNMNHFLKAQKTDFYSNITSLTNDKELFTYIILNLEYFKDESLYDNQNIYFYKRAQLLTSDILHIREIKENIKVDYSDIVGCADYKNPQVMRSYGILEFDNKLSNLVDNEIEIPANSEMEIEIRACDIVVIDYIANKLKNKISRIDINDYIWLLGQDKQNMTKKYHRTLTNKY